MATAPDDTTTTLLKVPPHSIEAERSVLGGLLLDATAWDAITGAELARHSVLNDTIEGLSLHGNRIALGTGTGRCYLAELLLDERAAHGGRGDSDR